jgi:hypothetical protein
VEFKGSQYIAVMIPVLDVVADIDVVGISFRVVVICAICEEELLGAVTILRETGPFEVDKTLRLPEDCNTTIALDELDMSNIVADDRLVELLLKLGEKYTKSVKTAELDENNRVYEELDGPVALEDSVLSEVLEVDGMILEEAETLELRIMSLVKIELVELSSKAIEERETLGELLELDSRTLLATDELVELFTA